MKIGGRKISNNNLEVVVLPRSDGDIVFRFKPVLTFDDFDKLVSMPDMPYVEDATGRKALPEDPTYRKAMSVYLEKKSCWMFLDSISATENLEWDKININDPSTWTSYDTEFTEAGITEIEQRMLRIAFERVNSLNEAHLEEARNRFLASTPAKAGQ